MSDNSGFTFSDITPSGIFNGAGQLTALTAGALPVVASSDLTPQHAPPSTLNGSVIVGGGDFLTSANAFGGFFNPSNNAFNPGGH